MTSEQKSRNMRSVRSKDSRIELLLRKSLWRLGVRYRIHVSDVFGKPDIAIKKVKLAVFIDSEFWHGHNWTKRMHDIKSNREFWIRKIQRNMERDRQVNQHLRSSGWTVLRYWGAEITRDPTRIATDIAAVYRQLKK